MVILGLRDTSLQSSQRQKKDCLSKAVLSRVLVPEAGIEPARPKWAQDFKSGASTYSATQALILLQKIPTYLIGTLSGKRDSNSRPRPWQGRALPTELFPRCLMVQRYAFFYYVQVFFHFFCIFLIFFYFLLIL